MSKNNSIVLVGDIGGTNANLGLVNFFNGKAKILDKKRIATPKIASFSPLIKEYLAYLKKEGFAVPKRACFAVAGLVEGGRGRLTNAQLVVDGKEIAKKTGIRKVSVINDFEAVSAAVPSIGRRDLLIVKKGKIERRGTIVVVGAGTGFGKSTLVWDKHRGAYGVLASEAGHCDLPIHGREEFEFVEWTRKRLRQTEPASWETALSGRGLVNIYEFLRKKRYSSKKEHSEIRRFGVSPDLISKYRKTDFLCKETFRWFERFYARAAKNAALDGLATGGVYIAGGIAAKNQDMFTSLFSRDFIDNLEHKEMLRRIPVYAITNYDVSLVGCARTLIKKESI